MLPVVLITYQLGQKPVLLKAVALLKGGKQQKALPNPKFVAILPIWPHPSLTPCLAQAGLKSDRRTWLEKQLQFLK